MTFLDRARSADTVEKICVGAVKCWPEIIAVVEAAEEPDLYYELMVALEALDKGGCLVIRIGHLTDGDVQRVIAQKYNVNRTTISRVVRGVGGWSSTA